MTKHHHQQPSLESEHNGMPSSSKPTTGNILAKETTIENLTVKQLKVILRAKGCTVSGTKAELINRVMQSSEYDGRAQAPSVPARKPKSWQHSIAKKELKRALLDPTSKIHTMSISEIQQSNDQYKQYSNFPKYYQALQLQIKEEKMQVKADDIAAADQLRQNPRHPLNKRGYPHWDSHTAKQLLEHDIANKLNEQLSPQQLRMTRDAYKEFLPKVFAQRVHAEKSKQRAASFWALKRNREGLVRHMNKLKL